MTSPRQAGLDTSSDRTRKVLSVLGVVALVWLVASSAIWVITYDGSGADLEQPGVTSPQQPGGFGNTTTSQQQGVVSNAPSPQPQGLTTVVGQTYTIPAQK